LRTQQILAYETGVARVADPLGGSYFIEALTDGTEARIVEIMADLEARGGMVQAIEGGPRRLPASDHHRGPLPPDRHPDPRRRPHPRLPPPARARHPMG
jgi:hypothetical protein